jgi:hypothetical protein
MKVKDMKKTAITAQTASVPATQAKAPEKGVPVAVPGEITVTISNGTKTVKLSSYVEDNRIFDIDDNIKIPGLVDRDIEDDGVRQIVGIKIDSDDFVYGQVVYVTEDGDDVVLEDGITEAHLQ